MKIIKRLALVLLIVFGLFYFLGLPYLRKQTKKISPERVTSYTYKGADLSVHYSAPHKKNRVIFGELVPYGQVWRTGANEPTTFTTSKNLTIVDKNLPKGTYSLWTIPNKDSWQVIFNTEVPDWGVSLISGGKKTTRDPEKDVLQVEVPTSKLDQPIDQFIISFSQEEPMYLSLAWDTTKISIPISISPNN
jgi:hypothetical protein